jgi:hypothetical protein
MTRFLPKPFLNPLTLLASRTSLGSANDFNELAKLSAGASAENQRSTKDRLPPHSGCPICGERAGLSRGPPPTVTSCSTTATRSARLDRVVRGPAASSHLGVPKDGRQARCGRPSPRLCLATAFAGVRIRAMVVRGASPRGSGAQYTKRKAVQLLRRSANEARRMSGGDWGR